MRTADKSNPSFSWLKTQTVAIPLEAFAIPAPELAKDLLGCVLFHKGSAGMIVETEAYLGEDDLAAHSSRGITPRTKVIFGAGGHAYTYLIYGRYECLNVVADVAGKPGCVLIRALEPLAGVDLMAERRQFHGPTSQLANGPGKLTIAMDISRQHYGRRLDRGTLTIRRFQEKPNFEVEITPRIGISQCVDWPLRFVFAGHPCLSR